MTTPQFSVALSRDTFSIKNITTLHLNDDNISEDFIGKKSFVHIGPELTRILVTKAFDTTFKQTNSGDPVSYFQTNEGNKFEITLHKGFASGSPTNENNSAILTLIQNISDISSVIEDIDYILSSVGLNIVSYHFDRQVDDTFFIIFTVDLPAIFDLNVQVSPSES